MTTTSFTRILGRLALAGTLVGLPFLAFVPATAQQVNIFQMTQEERTAYFAKLNEATERNWQHAIDSLGIPLPAKLPAPEADPARPHGTFQKPGATNWTDSSNNTYVRTAWGTWNNYDESRANPHPNLPDLLVANDGRRISTAEEWWSKRRPEIVAAFDTAIYGQVPANLPDIQWRVVRTSDTTMGGIPIVSRDIVGHIEGPAGTKAPVDIQVTLTTPKKAKGAVPLVMEFGFIMPPGFSFPGMPKPVGPTWQEQILSRGWGYAIYVPTSVQPDNGAGLTEGIIGLANGGRMRSRYQWGALRAWAWGASRILDYLEKDPSVDAKKVAIEGVSRYGKAVLVTMASDQRFAIGLVASSGKGGAALFRRNFGESTENICSSSEYHWFADNFLHYATSPEKLPVDSHEMFALCAPRPVFVSCGSPTVEGRWIDDEGQFMAEAAASPAYTLLGKPGLGTSTFPPLGTTLATGLLAYRQHEDGHAVGPNWPFFLDFAGKTVFTETGSPVH